MVVLGAVFQGPEWTLFVSALLGTWLLGAIATLVWTANAVRHKEWPAAIGRFVIGALGTSVAGIAAASGVASILY